MRSYLVGFYQYNDMKAPKPIVVLKTNQYSYDSLPPTMLFVQTIVVKDRTEANARIREYDAVAESYAARGAVPERSDIGFNNISGTVFSMINVDIEAFQRFVRKKISLRESK